MWNWEVTALATGCSLVLYDGSPLHPHTAVMWDLVDRCGITVFGTSAEWIAVQEERGLKPRSSHNLSTLRAILSTGSPLAPRSYDYVYRDIKADVLLASISGGTDIIACFMGENSTLPVYRGEIQSAHLGCGIEASSTVFIIFCVETVPWKCHQQNKENGTARDWQCVNEFHSVDTALVIGMSASIDEQPPCGSENETGN